jgi:hypothetical protein
MTIHARDLPPHIRRQLEGQPERGQDAPETPTTAVAKRKARTPRKPVERAVGSVEGAEGVVGVLAGERHRWQFKRAWNGVAADLYVSDCGIGQGSEPKAGDGSEPWCSKCAEV